MESFNLHLTWLSTKKAMCMLLTMTTRIQVFTPEGVYLRQFGKRGQIAPPVSIAIDSQNVVYVSDFSSGPVIKMFTTSGEFIKSFGSFYLGVTGLAVDKNRTLYISESGADCVHVYNYK